MQKNYGYEFGPQKVDMTNQGRSGDHVTNSSPILAVKKDYNVGAMHASVPVPK
jgi:hypothetical protein